MENACEDLLEVRFVPRSKVRTIVAWCCCQSEAKLATTCQQRDEQTPWQRRMARGWKFSGANQRHPNHHPKAPKILTCCSHNAGEHTSDIKSNKVYDILQIYEVTKYD